MVKMPTVKEFEQKFVHDVYEKLFTKQPTGQNRSTRKKWSKVVEFLCSFPDYSMIADLGCGDGRYLQTTQGYTLGVERCRQYCNDDQTHNLIIADILHLPLRGELFDGIICTSVIHHFATGRRRLKALQEITRMLKPGGRVFISVWGIGDLYKEFSGCDVLVSVKTRKYQRAKKQTGDDEFSASFDLLERLLAEYRHLKEKIQTSIPPRDFIAHSNNSEQQIEHPRPLILKSEVQDHRYYHVFSQKELIELILVKVKTLKVVDTFYDDFSLVFILQKR